MGIFEDFESESVGMLKTYGITQGDIAKKCGLTRSFVSLVFSGKRSTKRLTARGIRQAAMELVESELEKKRKRLEFEESELESWKARLKSLDA